jgi:hypothetical protein
MTGQEILMDQKDDDKSEPSARAVFCGRLVFIFVGVTLFAVPAFCILLDASHNLLRDWLCIMAGAGVIIAGFVLPPKTVANAGFDLPFFLPDDD